MGAGSGRSLDSAADLTTSGWAGTAGVHPLRRTCLGLLIAGAALLRRGSGFAGGLPNSSRLSFGSSSPKFVSDVVALSLSVTFLSLVFWTFVIGPVGAILAVPLTLLAQSLSFDVDARTR